MAISKYDLGDIVILRKHRALYPDVREPNIITGIADNGYYFSKVGSNSPRYIGSKVLKDELLEPNSTEIVLYGAKRKIF